MSVYRPSSVRVLNDQPVPMRDGVRLSADVYLPDDGDGPWPVLLSRTPYDNTLLMDLGFFWAQNGYVHVAPTTSDWERTSSRAGRKRVTCRRTAS